MRSRNAAAMAGRAARALGVAALSASLFAALFFPALIVPALAAPQLQDVRFGAPDATKTRIVVDILGDPVYALSAEAAGQGRLIVDFRALDVGSGGDAPRRAAGLVGTYRYAGGQRSGARLAFDLKRTARVAQHFVIPPNADAPHARLVIDLEAADKAAFLASVPKATPDIADMIAQATAASATAPRTETEPPSQVAAATSKPVVTERQADASPENRAQSATAGSASTQTKPAPASPASAQSRADRPVVVIDPGHGGGDPGATGSDGSLEKDLTLAAALKLAEALEATGRFQVVLTRRDDTRLALHQRARVTRTALPDLFISLHADAHPDPEVRGGSVYTLSKEGAERSTREVLSDEEARVRDLDIKDVDATLGKILVNVAQREMLTESSKFASILVQALSGVTPLVNNTHRRGDLRVLLAPDVPAVLLELAFISNDADLKNLKSEKWRKKTMDAVAAAIDDYFAQKDTRSPLIEAKASGGSG